MQRCHRHLPELLKMTVDLEGSDLHLSINTPPQVRVHGKLRRLEMPDLTPTETKQLAYSVMTDVQKKRFEETLELDFSFGIRGHRALPLERVQPARRGGRRLPADSRADQGVQGSRPAAGAGDARRAAARPRARHRPTGSGKSTTLAAMLDKINNERNEHILTIEDPIEYIHQHKGCLVNQREVHSDTHGFSEALRAALREDPDIVLIGELRDLETTEAALRIAETGHLTFGTLHTNSAAQTINRIIDMFPAHQQSQIRTQLSLVLEGIVCQALLPKASGRGRVVAQEILVPDAGDPQPDPRGQDSPDLFVDAVGSGEARHADIQPVAGDVVYDEADHARSRR